MLKRREVGFTLIEIVLVMAISMSLAVIVLAGSSSLRRNAQFSDSVERTKELLVATKNQVNSTVNTDREEAGGISDTELLLGQAIVFSGNGSTQYYRYELYADADAEVPVPIRVKLVRTDNVMWGVTTRSVSAPTAGLYVAYLRTPDGTRAFSFTGTAATTAQRDTALMNAANYNSYAPAQQVLAMTGEDGRVANITVTTPGGLVTRRFL